MAVLSYARCRKDAGLPDRLVGIEMWFKVERPPLTARDKQALVWWLQRKAGKPVDDPTVIFGTLIDRRDPLTARTYYSDGSYRWGVSSDGQVRTGGGVKGWV